MFLLPSYVSVLTIYSIANLQDLAWGTKGSTGTKDLGGAKSKKGTDGKDTVELELPDEPEDVDNLWLHLRKDLGTKEVVVHQKRDVDQKKADQFANQRTNWLLAYLGCVPPPFRDGESRLTRGQNEHDYRHFLHFHFLVYFPGGPSKRDGWTRHQLVYGQSVFLSFRHE